MDKVKIGFLGVVAIFAAALLLSGDLVAAEVRDRRRRKRDDLICDGDFSLLYRSCGKYIKAGKINNPPPSRRCCQIVRLVDLYCICREIPARLERTVSMAKVSSVADTCRQPIRSGTRCGSFTVPTFPLGKRKRTPPPPPPPPRKIQEERKEYPPLPQPPKTQEWRMAPPPPLPRSPSRF